MPDFSFEPALEQDKAFFRQLNRYAYEALVVAEFGSWDEDIQHRNFEAKWLEQKLSRSQEPVRALTQQSSQQSSQQSPQQPAQEKGFQKILCVLSANQTESVCIGGLWVEEHLGHHQLREIQLVPDYRNLGLGTQLIEQVLRHASQKGKSTKLRVLMKNPAYPLYLRLGFRVYDQSETQYYMVNDGAEA